ncbi:MAG: GatB/YqeY domain-containing protein [candidate division KSB1 bacterium]|nr:GatB/YqeY domain-containing protein [candidate division KSB1 bacterium]MDZ7357666.1 GatB/YqeY domain-containing protein [candidate division KSB1 bacterium]MDZ7377186.1 GatB/YqeY domain-containing protein [candidate division KSB1 bacterium]MDZ7401541.1 GatB/YqeY domain-containing protein [candidate division KSB1 bacterium]
MSLLEQLTEDMKQALKAQDKLKLSTVRMLISQLKNERIDSGAELTGDQELQVLMNAAKKRKEAIDAYQKANRSDLAEKEQQELAIIQQYLPAQLSDEQIAAKIDEIIAAVGATSLKDLGKVMAEAMKALKGKADGKKVQQLVREKLA